MRLQCRSVPGGVPERPKGAVCKTVGSAYGGSNPPAPIPGEDATVFRKRSGSFAGVVVQLAKVQGFMFLK